MKLDFIGLEKLVNILLEFFVTYSFQVIGALITLVIGLLIARWASKFLIKACEKKGVDITLRIFLGNLAGIVIIIFVLIICLGKFGITVAPFIAAVGAVTLGASLALQGLFANYAAGLVIILTRPFVIGNTISVKGTAGIVDEITLSMTILSTEDGENIRVPNRHILGEILYNSFEYRVVEGVVGISYSDDPNIAIGVISDVFDNSEDIPKKPGPQIGIQKFGDSSINIGMRYWVPTQNYFQLQYKLNLAVYNALKEAAITIPFPQRDIHIKSTNELSK